MKKFYDILLDGPRKGGTRKIADLPTKVCTDKEHNPPDMMLLEPGIYEHECPVCGHKQTFVVPQKLHQS